MPPLLSQSTHLDAPILLGPHVSSIVKTPFRSALYRNLKWVSSGNKVSFLALSDMLGNEIQLYPKQKRNHFNFISYFLSLSCIKGQMR